MKARYRVHRFDIDMTKDQRKLEQFLNNLEGEVVAIIPSVNLSTNPFLFKTVSAHLTSLLTFRVKEAFS